MVCYKYSLESSQWAIDSNEYTLHSFSNKIRNVLKIFLNICFLELSEKCPRVKNEFKSAMVNEALVIESLPYLP